LHVIYFDFNRCLLSLFGAVLAAATLYDIWLQYKLHHNAGLHSTTADNGADGYNNLTNNPQPPVIRQAEDVPLLMGTPQYRPKSSRASGNFSLFLFFVVFFL